jgi:hypothetical protein
MSYSDAALLSIPASVEDELSSYYEFFASIKTRTACERLSEYKATVNLKSNLWKITYARALEIADENFVALTEEQLGALYKIIDDVYYAGHLLKRTVHIFVLFFDQSIILTILVHFKQGVRSVHQPGASAMQHRCLRLKSLALGRVNI